MIGRVSLLDRKNFLQLDDRFPDDHLGCIEVDHNQVGCLVDIGDVGYCVRAAVADNEPVLVGFDVVDPSDELNAEVEATVSARRLRYGLVAEVPDHLGVRTDRRERSTRHETSGIVWRSVEIDDRGLDAAHARRQLVTDNEIA